MEKNLYEILFLKGLVFTVLVEAAVFFPLYYFWLGKRSAAELLYGIFVCAAASVLTLPYVWFIIPAFVPDRTVYMISAEAFAFLLEAIIYRVLLKCRYREAFVLSLVCNAGSFGLGLLLFPNGIG
jgi:hypothetical protein